MTPIVRQATRADREAIWEFLRIAYGDLASYKFPDQWNWQFGDNPYLRSDDQNLAIWIAECDGRVVGQTCVYPVELKVGESVHPAVWGTDLIVLPEFRGQGLGERLSRAIIAHYPLYLALTMAAATRRMYNRMEDHNDVAPVAVYRRRGRLSRAYLMRYLQKRGRSRPGLKRLLMFAFRAGLLDRVMPLVANAWFDFRDLLRRQPRVLNHIQVTEVDRFGSDIDRVWDATCGGYDVIVKRDQGFLNWRFASQRQLGYRKFVARRDNETAGYMVLRKSLPIELSVGIISDLYAGREDHDTLAALIEHAIRFFGRDVALIECATTCPDYREVLTSLGFRSSTGTVPMFFCRDAGLKETLNGLMDRWHLTKSDQDWDRIAPV